MATQPGRGRPAEPPIPPGYEPGDYVPFHDRDRRFPTKVAGHWDDEDAGQGRPLTQEEQYRAIYGYDAPTRTTYASWGRRVLGYLVDTFFTAAAAVPLTLGCWMLTGEIELTEDAAGNRVLADGSDVSSTTLALLVVGGLVSLGFGIWNLVLRQGRTGYTLGKTVVGIRLVDAGSDVPIGAALCFLRQLAHVLDTVLCGLGWVWPLWDGRRQTYADKVVGSVVVILPQDQSGG
jgi:uncharacterized RDD family membrane protein YckC